jgi:hypothetical protein
MTMDVAELSSGGRQDITTSHPAPVQQSVEFGRRVNKVTFRVAGTSALLAVLAAAERE